MHRMWYIILYEMIRRAKALYQYFNFLVILHMFYFCIYEKQLYKCYS